VGDRARRWRRWRGVLLVPTLQLDYLNLTLLVIAAYAAAMVGRLKNLPRTFVGALVLGLLTSYSQWAVAYVPPEVDRTLGGLVQGTRIALPTIFLLAVMLMLPQDKLRVGRVAGTTLPPCRRGAGRWPGAPPSSRACGC
jgi:branched-chain amino acid transport system permease protein